MLSNLKKILYVEDDEDIAVVATMTLEEIGGFEIKHALSGSLALELLASYDPDLILMDVMMPGMDGVETYKEIRNLEKWESIPVIFMTAKAQTHEQKTYMDLGAIGVVVKPFDPMILCKTIKGFRDKHTV